MAVGILIEKIKLGTDGRWMDGVLLALAFWFKEQ
jgi:hypothetical protein